MQNRRRAAQAAKPAFLKEAFRFSLGRNETWRDKSPNYHLDRAMHHGLTYRMIRDGDEPANGEGQIKHLKNAITRLAMRLVKELDA